MNIDVSQARALSADLTRAPHKATRLARVVVAKTASDIEAGGKVLVAVDTGATLNSIGVDTHVGGLSADVGPTTDYAPYLENGTAFMAPRPFMGPAADQAEPSFVRAMEMITKGLV